MFQGKKCPCIFLTILENKFSPAHSVEPKFSYTKTEYSGLLKVIHL